MRPAVALASERTVGWEKVGNMITAQQQETLAYFEANAVAWQARANDVSEHKLNTLKQRYQYVWQVAQAAGPFRRVVDLGCGAGDALWPLARSGASCLGIDFAPSMITLARQAADEQGLSNCQFLVGNLLE